MSEFIEFKSIPNTGKTAIWQVVNTHYGTILGIIKWYGAWRQYCFFPSPLTIFSRGCMADIERFIESAMQSRKTS